MNARPDELKLADVMQVIDQIHEPQKVVVPKEVAVWLEWCKENSLTLSEALSAKENKSDDLQTAVNEWFTSNHEDLFAHAWLFGYEVEQEKLYTVELPNPNNIGTEVHILMMNGFKQVVIKKELGNDWKKKKGFQLTEEEIKQDFEWAWQFAKEVE